MQIRRLDNTEWYDLKAQRKKRIYSNALILLLQNHLDVCSLIHIIFIEVFSEQFPILGT